MVEVKYNANTVSMDLDVNSATVATLMDEVQKVFGVPVAAQHILYDRKEISLYGHAFTLADIGVISDSNIFVIESPSQSRGTFVDFLQKAKPPANYVAGVGRGATGFSTPQLHSDRPFALPGGSVPAEAKDVGLVVSEEVIEKPTSSNPSSTTARLEELGGDLNKGRV